MNIIELAEQAGLAYKTPKGKYWIDAGYPDIHLERFAELVAEQTHTNNKAKWYQEGYEAGQHDMFTKSQNVDTSAERVHEIDKSIHDFKPVWDMIEPYHERIKELEIENERLLQALAQPEQEPVAWISDSPTKGNGKQLHFTKADAWRWSSNITPLYTAPSKEWVSLSDKDITGAAHNKARYPVSIVETTDSGLCMQFSEAGEWHASDKRGDFMKVNSFLMSFARAIEATLRSKNHE